MDIRSWVRGPWGVGGMVGLVAVVLAGVGVFRPPGRIDVFLEPAGAVGSDPFLILESPELRIGAAEMLTLGGGVTVRVGIEPGLYGGSGSDHLCDPQLIADFLDQDPAKATAWASAAGIGVGDIELYLLSLTPVRLLADTWVTNHGFRNGQAIPHQSILQAGTMVLVDNLGVPRVRCRCGNPLLPPDGSDDLGRVDFVGERWDGFDPDRLLVVEAGTELVEGFILVRLEDGRLVARPIGTTGDQDAPVDEEGRWIPELDLVLPLVAAVGDGPFPLPEVSSAGLDIEYRVDGPCRIGNGALVLDGRGLCVLSVFSEADDPWAPFEFEYEIDIGLLEQMITFAPLHRIVLGEDPVTLGATADSLLPVQYETAGPCEVVSGALVASGIGSCEITITQPGNARWESAEPLAITVEVSGGSPRQSLELTFEPPTSLRLDDEPVALEAESDPPRPISYFVVGACDLAPGDSLRPQSVGECGVLAAAADDDDFQRAVATRTVIVRPRLQQVGLDTLPRFAILSDATVPLPATTSVGFDVSYEVSGSCRLTADGLLFTKVGTCEVTGSADGDDETEPVTETFEITISQASTRRQSQSITFSQPGNLVVGGEGEALSASASSGLIVSLTLTDGDCRLEDRTLTPGSAGRCTVTASQNGDTTYKPADSVSRTVTVAKATPTLTISVGGGSATEMVEGETRTVTGSVSSGPAPSIIEVTGSCTTSGGDVVVATGSGTGDCRVTVGTPGDASHTAVSDSVTIGVKQLQTVNLSLPSASTFVGQRLQPTASASSGLGVVVGAGPSGVCRIDGTQILAVGSGTCTVTADQAGNADFAPASASASLTVQAKRSPTIDIDAPSSMTVGDQVTITATSSESGVVITIELTGSACQDNGNGSVVAVARGTCTVTASHPATNEAEAASASKTITVVGLADDLSFDCGMLCDVRVGQRLTVTVQSISGLGMAASVSGPCTIVGEDPAGGIHYVVIEGDSIGSCTLTASTSGDSQWNPASESLSLNVSGIPASLTFDLGHDLEVDESRSFDVVHNVPTSSVVVQISSSAACNADIDSVGLNATVVGVAIGTCTVTITIGGGNYTTVSKSDSAYVDIPR
ncbi:MAG: hypothetical protein GY724_01550 [Actinomycetia bacterium]|nr:hypothetical protein [Actinomycetes bacterium]